MRFAGRWVLQNRRQGPLPDAQVGKITAKRARYDPTVTGINYGRPDNHMSDVWTYHSECLPRKLRVMIERHYGALKIVVKRFLIALRKYQVVNSPESVAALLD